MSFPLPHVCVLSEVYGHITLPKVFTHLLWMLWWTSMAEVITSQYQPQGSFSGRSLGDHLTIVLLWHHLCFTSYRGSGMGLGTPVLCMMDAYT